VDEFADFIFDHPVGEKERWYWDSDFDVEFGEGEGHCMRISRLWSTVPVLLSVCLLSWTLLSVHAQGKANTEIAQERELPGPGRRVRGEDGRPSENQDWQARRHEREQATTSSSKPTGLVVVLAPGKPGEQLELRALNNPFISGVSAQMNWRDIEPVQGQPDWSRLDELFAAAESGKKWVHLLIFPGYFAPAWAKEGAEADMFAIQYGPGAGTIEKLPMPWDKVYLTRWFAFLKQLSDRYGSLPAFRMIGAAGPTSVSTEMTLPNRPQDHRKWLDHSYTMKKYQGAWQEVFRVYAAYFPNQCVSLTAPGVPILGPGTQDPDERKRARVAIVDQAFGILGRRLALEGDNLHAGYVRVDGPDLTGFLNSYSGRIITGLEMRCPAERGSLAMGAEGDPPLALRRSINKGMQLNTAGQHINYLGIYAKDVVADEMQPVLQYAASLFEGKQLPERSPEVGQRVRGEESRSSENEDSERGIER